MHHADTRVIAALFGLFHRFFGGSSASAFGHKRSHVRIMPFQLFGQRMIWRYRRKRRAHQCVGAGCINLEPCKPVRRARRFKRKL